MHAHPEPWQGPDGREQVNRYPRPPALVPCTRHVRIEVLGRVLCDTSRSLRILETFHPPTYYLPPDAIKVDLLRPAPGRSFCEWKGVARWFDVVVPCEGGGEDRRDAAVWQYPEPTPAYEALSGWFAVYPGKMDGCWIDGERVRPQPGRFYGGWITDDLEGPFKGDLLHPYLI